MVAKLVLFFLLTASVLTNGNFRGNIAFGDTFGSHIIYQETHEKYAIPLVVRDETIIVKTMGNEVIKAIMVSDLKGGGRSYLVDGGIGRKTVTIKLESERGSGYKFLVQVYAI
ncbi:unnamed protein product [Arctia plantaginis]|uniref:Uncharacterized protein n=1 Tax=Arctia plantaginis TaxID=874455 RepID=A0A8S0Z1L8_ARCPL|nr:unnamed protein product [Arctia plantaginis]